MLNASDVAKYVINKCNRDKHPISNLQLQKILYYLQVYFLQKKGKPLFMDEIEAWQFGPAIHEVYGRYCGFGAIPINISYDCSLPLAAQDMDAINTIVSEKRTKWPWELVEETHAKGKPWYEIYANGLGNRCVIPLWLIKEKG